MNAETKPKKIYELIGVSLCPPSSPDLKPFDYAIRRILETKIYSTSHPNIGSLKTVVEEEWNKVCKKFIFKAYKSFRRRVDTITGEKKNGSHIE